ncbi:MAG: co-chaperone GroES [Simkaniaceae bacterium]|nr:co-chaperone GroES [Simkaniaceae bacterium]
MQKVKPLGNRILVKRAEAEKTKGGIFLPESSKEKPKKGEVIAAGPGKANDKGILEPMQVKVGDQVLFTSYAGTEVKAQDECEYLIMSEEDVLAVVQ